MQVMYDAIVCRNVNVDRACERARLDLIQCQRCREGVRVFAKYREAETSCGAVAITTFAGRFKFYRDGAAVIVLINSVRESMVAPRLSKTKS